MANEKPIIINLFAGPGAGKTTTAMEISAELKKKGINLEYVPEYAKELVYAERYDLLADQAHVTDTQYQRFDALRGKVDVIVTDSPVLLGLIYGKGKLSPENEQKVKEYHNSFDTFNLFIERGEGYQQDGRRETRTEAEEKDREIRQMLKDNGVYYGVYNHDNVQKLIENIQVTLEKREKVAQRSERTAEPSAPRAASGKSTWRKVVVPTEWRVKQYDKVAFYRFGKEAGELAGYSISHPKAMLHTNESVTVKYGDPATEVKAVCDRLIFRADASITLKKGDEQKKVTGKELATALERSLEAFTQAKNAQKEIGQAEVTPKEKNSKNGVFEPLKAIPQEMREVLTGSFDEDIFDANDKQVFLSTVAEGYIVADNGDMEFNEAGELVLKQSAREEMAHRISQGEKCVFATESDAIMALLGGNSKTYEAMSEQDRSNVDTAYLALIDATDKEYYDTLPSKEAFAKEYLIKKNWAKYQNYHNDRAYEQNTPYPLRDRQIFVCWKFVYYNENGEPYTKPQKVPFSPHYDGRAKSGSQDGSHIKTWGTFDEACKAVDKYGYDGIGIMFGNGVMGIDIDGCIKDGQISDAARDIVTRVNSYTEYSPSGTGVHTLCFGSIPKGSRNDAIGLEMYPSGRFFTLTGHRFENYSRMAKKADCQPVIDEIYNENFGQRTAAAIVNPVGAPTEQTYTSAEIVKRLLSAPKMADKFRRLCQGKPPRVWDAAKEQWTDRVDSNFLKEDGSPDGSKLDYAFCKMLVFFRATAQQIDEIYRAQESGASVEGLTVDGGGLARDKWDRRQGAEGTYGQYVINNAFKGVTALYDPATAKPFAKGFAERKKSSYNDME